MSKWLEIEGDNVRLRRTGIYWHANWKTNNPPDVAFKRYAFGSPSVDEFHRTLRYVEPFLGRLMSQMASRGGLAVEFPDYMMRVYSENGIECKRIEAIMRFLEQEGERRKTDISDDSENG